MLNQSVVPYRVLTVASWPAYRFLRRQVRWSWQESNDKPRQGIEKQRHYSAHKGPYSQGYGLPSSYVKLWEPDSKGRAPRNWNFQTVVLEKTLETPLENKEIKPGNLKGNKPRIVFGRTGTKAEAPILWPHDANGWLIGKRPWCWERLKAEGEEGDRGWDDWKASLIQRRWTWVNSRRWWGTGKPGVLQSVRTGSVRYDLETEKQQGGWGGEGAWREFTSEVPIDNVG